MVVGNNHTAPHRSEWLIFERDGEFTFAFWLPLPVVVTQPFLRHFNYTVKYVKWIHRVPKCACWCYQTRQSGKRLQHSYAFEISSFTWRWCDETPPHQRERERERHTTAAKGRYQDLRKSQFVHNLFTIKMEIIKFALWRRFRGWWSCDSVCHM